MDIKNSTNEELANEARRLLRNRAISTVQELAGELAPQMIADRTEAVRMLHHSSVEVRDAALLLLSAHWPLAPDILPQLLDLIRTDPDESNRHSSLLMVGRITRGTLNPDVASVLSQRAADTSESDENRAVAARGLLALDPRADAEPRRLSADLAEIARVEEPE